MDTNKLLNDNHSYGMYAYIWATGSAAVFNCIYQITETLDNRYKLEAIDFTPNRNTYFIDEVETKEMAAGIAEAWHRHAIDYLEKTKYLEQ